MPHYGNFCPSSNAIKKNKKENLVDPTRIPLRRRRCIPFPVQIRLYTPRIVVLVVFSSSRYGKGSSGKTVVYSFPFFWISVASNGRIEADMHAHV